MLPELVSGAACVGSVMLTPATASMGRSFANPK